MLVFDAPALAAKDWFGPAVSAVVFVAIMSLVPEPARRRFNAIFAAGAVGAYIGSSFGPWELIYPVVATPLVYFGLKSHRFLGIAWLMHGGWDWLHHFWGRPIWPFLRTSSFGCMIFDSLIAVWFLAGAPSLNRGRADAQSGASAEAIHIGDAP